MTDAREAELLAKIKALDERLARMEVLEKQNALLRQKLDLLIRKLFGAQSEKLDPAQLLLLLQGLDEPGKPPEPVAPEEPRRSMVPSPPRERRPRLPEHLPVIEEVLDPVPVQACPQDWRCIGEEVSEQLDYEPARFLRRRLIRRKYVRRRAIDAVPVIAPLPESLQERCLAAPGVARANPRRQILRPPSTLPAGANLSHPARCLSSEAKHGALGWSRGRLAAADLRNDAHWSHGRRLCASR